MKEIKFRHILIAAFAPLVLLSVVTWCITMIRYRELNGIGIIVLVYYSVPVLIFTGLFAVLIDFFRRTRIRWLSATIVGQAVVSLGLMICLLSVWIFFDHGARFDKTGFAGYYGLM